MKRILILLAIVAGILFNQPLYAASGEVLNLINKTQTAYENTRTFEAAFKQKLTHKESGSQETRSGKLLFQKPLQIRWQTAAPHEETLIVTSKEIWDYIPDEEIAYKYPPSLVDDSSSIIKVITGQAALNSDFDVKKGSREKGLQQLVLYPNEPSTQLVEAKIWVDPESGFIKKVVIIDFYGNENQIELTRITPNANISSSAFKFTPPKGVEIEDRLNTAPGEKELFK